MSRSTVLRVRDSQCCVGRYDRVELTWRVMKSLAGGVVGVEKERSGAFQLRVPEPSTWDF